MLKQAFSYIITGIEKRYDFFEGIMKYLTDTHLHNKPTARNLPWRQTCNNMQN